MADLAEVSIVEQAWRPLTAAERTKAEYWIGRASRRIRSRWRDVDDRLAAGTLDAAEVQDVAVEMVLAVLGGPPIRGAKSFSEGVGPMSRSATLVGASADPLVIEDWMVEVFEGRTTTRPSGSFPLSGNYDRISIWPEGSY